jgi:hypothetical protein
MYKMEVRVDDGCREVSDRIRKFEIPEVSNGTVTDFVIRAGKGRGIELVELSKKGKPKKPDGGENRVK